MPKRIPPSIQIQLPGVQGAKKQRSMEPLKKNRIPLKTLLASLQSSSGECHTLVEIYQNNVLPNKTRTIHLLGRKCSAKIIHTLLGFEVQASYKRIQCPDMVTARYLKLFSELGCRVVKLPYDPTVTEKIVPQMERLVQALQFGVKGLFAQNHELQVYAIMMFYQHIRKDLQTLHQKGAIPADQTSIAP